MAVIVTSLGAAFTTLLGVLVGSALSSRSEQRHWSRDRQADACAQVLRESSNVLIEFARLWREPMDPSPDGANVPTPMDWRPWNEALAMVSLVGGYEIVEAAVAIDVQMWPVHQQIKRGWAPEGGWPSLRDPIEARRQDFVNIARKHLAPPGPPLKRLTGRPATDDPFWELRRSYFSPPEDDHVRRQPVASPVEVGSPEQLSNPEDTGPQ
jgi:hypothetical protein